MNNSPHARSKEALTILEGIPMETIIARGICVIDTEAFPETVHRIVMGSTSTLLYTIIISDGNVFVERIDGTTAITSRNTFLIDTNNVKVERDAEGKILIAPKSQNALRIISTELTDRRSIRHVRKPEKKEIPKEIMRSIQEANHTEPSTFREKIARALRAILDGIKKF